MPAPEVVGAVGGVEEPVEVHGDDAADRPREQELLHLHARWRVAVVEGDGDPAPTRALGVEDALAALRVDRHGLLGDHVAAELECLTDVLGVPPVGAGDDDGVRSTLLDHPRIALCVVAQNVELALAGELDAVVESARVAVAHAHQLAAVGVPLGETDRVEPGASPQAHLRVASPRRHPAPRPSASSFLRTSSVPVQPSTTSRSPTHSQEKPGRRDSGVQSSGAGSSPTSHASRPHRRGAA
jgi:hypothetical protein